MNNQNDFLNLHYQYDQAQQKTVLSSKKNNGQLGVQKTFYDESNILNTLIVYPAGGLVGGDKLSVDVQTEPNTHSLITAPGANKFYRSQKNWCTQNQTLKVAPEAVLEYLPSEIIIFNHAKAKLATTIDLAPTSTLLFWEIIGLGRPTINEPFDKVSLDQTLTINHPDGVLFFEQTTLNEQLPNHFLKFSQFNWYATFYVYSPQIDSIKKRTLHIPSDPQTYHAATKINNLFIIRVLSQHWYQVRDTLFQYWAFLRTALLQKPANLPRIWLT